MYDTRTLLLAETFFGCFYIAYDYHIIKFWFFCFYIVCTSHFQEFCLFCFYIARGFTLQYNAFGVFKMNVAHTWKNIDFAVFYIAFGLHIAESFFCWYYIACCSHLAESCFAVFTLQMTCTLQNHSSIIHGLRLQNPVFVTFTLHAAHKLLFWSHGGIRRVLNWMWLTCCRWTVLCKLHSIHEVRALNQRYRELYQGEI